MKGYFYAQLNIVWKSAPYKCIFIIIIINIIIIIIIVIWNSEEFEITTEFEIDDSKWLK